MEVSRGELSRSLVMLRSEVSALTDWRAQVSNHRREATIAAAAAGFVIGALLLPRRRKR
jgi:hypothetical protein